MQWRKLLTSLWLCVEQSLPQWYFERSNTNSRAAVVICRRNATDITSGHQRHSPTIHLSLRRLSRHFVLSSIIRTALRTIARTQHGDRSNTTLHTSIPHPTRHRQHPSICGTHCQYISLYFSKIVGLAPCPSSSLPFNIETITKRRPASPSQCTSIDVILLLTIKIVIILYSLLFLTFLWSLACLSVP